MDVKEQILEKSLGLFMRYGIKSVSMDDISREIGVSKKTVYQHVSDKRDLVRQTFERHLNSDEAFCTRMMDETNNPIQQLLNLAKHIVDNFSQMNPSTMFDIQKYYPSCWELFHDHKNKYIQSQVIDNLKLGIKTGHYRPELNVDIISKLYICLIDSTVNPDTFPAKEFDRVSIFVQLFDYHLHAIMTSEGTKYFNKHKESFFN
ncbi:MAG: AcrR family transcriptional regulator [bacterium]|jgi:AcrR family transcriptional regulator